MSYNRPPRITADYTEYERDTPTGVLLDWRYRYGRCGVAEAERRARAKAASTPGWTVRMHQGHAIVASSPR